MTRAIARVVLWVALLGVLVVSSSHTIYYLLGWEWNRASIAAAGFVAALVTTATALVFERLRRIEVKVDQLLAQSATAHPREGAPEPAEVDGEAEPRPDFPWLSQFSVTGVALLALLPVEAPDHAVFIPVFLAAGLVLSALAAGVERLAAFLERRRAPLPRTVPVRPLAPLREQGPWALAALAMAGVLMITGAVGGLYWLSHYWSEPIGPGVTTMTVEVENKGPTTTPSDVVETVGRMCSLDTGTGIEFSGVAPGPAGSTLLRVEPLLDEDAQNRYIGCLEDAILEWHSLSVTRTTLDPQ